MVREEQNRNDWTRDELYHAVLAADWDIGKTSVHSQGVTLTFRKHFTSDFPGMETREVSGTDDADAMRQFLAELDREESEGYDA